MTTILPSPLQPPHTDLIPSPSKAALVVIDMQVPYFQNPVLKRKKNDLVKQCNALIELFQRSSRPVFLTRTVHSRDEQTWTLNMRRHQQGFAAAGDDETAFVGGLQYNEHAAIVINKTRDSAFVATDFEAQLRRQGVTTLVMCGVSTHSCVGLTAADAYARNLFTLFATDAIASHKEKYHSGMLTMLEEEYNQPTLTTSQVATFLKTGQLPDDT